MIRADTAPTLASLPGNAVKRYTGCRGVFPSVTRVTSASIATGCHPGRHGLLGNTMVLDEGAGLICLSVAKPEFRDRMRKATGRTLLAPTLAERLAGHGGVIVMSNVSAGAAYFQDPDGFGHVYHSAGSFGPGLVLVPDAEHLDIQKGEAGDAVMTARFCDEVLRERKPPLSVLWLSEPDYTGHKSPLGSPAHLSAIRAADRCVKQVLDAVRALDEHGVHVDSARGRFHAVIRADDQERLVVEGAHGVEHLLDAPVGGADGRQVRGRAQR